MWAPRELDPLLAALAESQESLPDIRDRLIQSLHDPLERAWGPSALSAERLVHERLSILRRIWPRFRSWWRQAHGVWVPLESLWHVYIPLAQWILEQKRARSQSLYVFGIHGTLGRGKTTLAQALGLILEEILPGRMGRPLVLSLDDYYLPKRTRERAAFRDRGYNPSGISNRGPAGTHDIGLLWRHIKEMESSAGQSLFDLPVFDKQADDRLARPRQVKGKIGVVLLEGWLVGCRTDVPVERMSSPLRRSVARALRDYRHLFDRLDALWAFRPPSIEEIISQRWRQQEGLNRLSGREGMSLDQIRRFVNYFYQEAWEPGVSSPTPPESRVSFWASMDRDYRFTDFRRGGLRMRS